jgi:hypothetical protein
MSKVSPEPNTGCWLWTSITGSTGYALFHNVKIVSAHRWSYEHFRQQSIELGIGPVCMEKSFVQALRGLCLRNATCLNNRGARTVKRIGEKDGDTTDAEH